MRDIKLVAIDMDGTLLNDDYEISLRNREKIRSLLDRGKKVILATGRTFQSARYYAKQLNLDIPIITYNGALIKETLSEKVIYSEKIDLEYVKKLLEFGEKYSVYTKVYINDVLHVKSECEEARIFSHRHRIDYKNIGKLSEEVKENPHLIVFKDSVDKINAVKEKLETELKLPISYTMSTPYSLEFMAKGISKASSLEYLTNILDIKRDETLAIGNGLNDLDMLRWAGIGVAMKNSDRSLLEKWSSISEYDNNDDGVSYILDKILLRNSYTK